jgi:acetate kinase
LSEVIAVVNAGSATIKFAVYAVAAGELGRLICRGLAENTSAGGRIKLTDAGGQLVFEHSIAAQPSEVLGPAHLLTPALSALEQHINNAEIVAIGHRVVHGGERFSAPVLLDPAAVDELERLVPLAPLHQPHNLAPIRALMAAKPDTPQVACFDTAFHRTQPRVAQMFGLPTRFFDSGVKRYGFHGLSYEYVAGVLPDFVGERADGNVIVAHLGNGASMCAMKTRQSIATTMGFTALEGLVMGTRCGSIDPGVILYLMDAQGMSSREVAHLLYQESGLLGLSGLSADVRELLASASPCAAEALRVFSYRAVRKIGSLAAALGGLDALVFTGGIGEHAAPVRESICAGAAWLGVGLDLGANQAHGPVISAPSSRVSVAVVRTDEERVIANHTLRIAASPPKR